jgi:hypothetical protein
MSNIVNVNVSVQAASAPSTLQATGAIVTQGGTTTSSGTYTLLTSASSLTAILAAPKAITAMTWALGVVTATVSGGHGYPVSANPISATIAGVAPTGYNGTYAITVTSSTQFTYALAVNPGTSTTQGTVTNYNAGLLTNSVATFFAQGTAGSVYVLELGSGTAAAGVTALQAWITANAGIFYAYLLPVLWDAEATTLAFVNNYTSVSTAVYFFLPVTATSWATYNGVKSVVMVSNAPTSALTEVPSAAPFHLMIGYAPSATNLVTQAAYSYMYGLTAWNVNSTSIPTMETAKVNYMASGAEGGLSNVILKKGVMADGSSIQHNYSVDWVYINGKMALAAAIINGSNSAVNPLYYNQNGINRLQATLQSIINNGVSFGMLGGTPVVNATSYVDYTAANPTDYANGIYNGLSVTISTQQGFLTITFNLVISNLAP